MSPIVRRLDAAIGETIEICWVRRIPDPQDPTKRLTQQLIQRHTAPPSTVWDAQHAEQEQDPHE